MIRIFFGSPGSGKTTFAVMFLKKAVKKDKRISYSNINDSFSRSLDPRVLCDYKLPKGSYIVIDESGIEFNSRDHKNFKQGFIQFFKLHRHESYDIDFFSQDWEDTDKIIRVLASEYWYVRNMGIFSLARRYHKKVFINDQNHQIEYGFYKKSILWQLVPFAEKQLIFCWRPAFYKFFNSFSPIPRPVLEDASRVPEARENF